MLFALIFLALFLPTRGQAQVLYAASGSLGTAGELYIINPLDGSALFDVGPLNDRDGNNYSLTGLRYDPDNAVFYGATTPTSTTDPAYLVVINPVTARVKPIGPLGTRLTDLAYDPTTGNMYGVSGSSDGFYIIDLNTGAATALGHTGVHPQNGGGLAADSSGMIYGVTDRTFCLYDKSTGAATKIGRTGLTLFVRGLAFDLTNTLYGIDGGGLDNNSNLRNLITINPATGRATEVGPTLKNLDGLAFLPTLAAQRDPVSPAGLRRAPALAMVAALFLPPGTNGALACGIRVRAPDSLGIR